MYFIKWLVIVGCLLSFGFHCVGQIYPFALKKGVYKIPADSSIEFKFHGNEIAFDFRRQSGSGVVFDSVSFATGCGKVFIGNKAYDWQDALNKNIFTIKNYLKLNYNKYGEFIFNDSDKYLFSNNTHNDIEITNSGFLFFAPRNDTTTPTHYIGSIGYWDQFNHHDWQYNTWQDMLLHVSVSDTSLVPNYISANAMLFQKYGIFNAVKEYKLSNYVSNRTKFLDRFGYGAISIMDNDIGFIKYLYVKVLMAKINQSGNFKMIIAGFRHSVANNRYIIDTGVFIQPIEFDTWTDAKKMLDDGTPKNKIVFMTPALYEQITYLFPDSCSYFSNVTKDRFVFCNSEGPDNFNFIEYKRKNVIDIYHYFQKSLNIDTLLFYDSFESYFAKYPQNVTVIYTNNVHKYRRHYNHYKNYSYNIKISFGNGKSNYDIDCCAFTEVKKMSVKKYYSSLHENIVKLNKLDNSLCIAELFSQARTATNAQYPGISDNFELIMTHY